MIDWLRRALLLLITVGPGPYGWSKLPHVVNGGLALTLVELDRLNDGAVWLRYEVDS